MTKTFHTKFDCRLFTSARTSRTKSLSASCLSVRTRLFFLHSAATKEEEDKGEERKANSNFLIYKYRYKNAGYAVAQLVEALRYKPEGRRSGRIVALGSTQPLNRNEYQESFLGVKTAGA